MKIKVCRVGLGFWRIQTPVLLKSEGHWVREMHFGGMVATGIDAIELAARELQAIQRYLAAGWVAEA